MNHNDSDHILLVGANHETAPVAIRECLAFSEADVPAALDKLMTMPAIQEVILFSTCNRLEVLLTTGDVPAAARSVKKFLAETGGLEGRQLDQICYQYEDDAAVRHLFRVAAGLDSMGMGEPQIFGQVKAAYRLAGDKKATDR